MHLCDPYTVWSFIYYSNRQLLKVRGALSLLLITLSLLQLVFYLDACYSGSMFDNLPDDIGGQLQQHKKHSGSILHIHLEKMYFFLSMLQCLPQPLPTRMNLPMVAAGIRMCMLMLELLTVWSGWRTLTRYTKFNVVTSYSWRIFCRVEGGGEAERETHCMDNGPWNYMPYYASHKPLA